ncbi:hypothetical protein N7462_002496 [Penicillium macrosclerotiorum]|uniref:uncharacterized protein n=1 Tax=Penicillium macrosclerotiorum TaxID=303699 RepID=UPI002549825D|nr:uncharacterized protein N7462_002496 [Penicillium macrosclerotiorum]KAJ5693073.1 hypothetical protein N7462_002496 [Penicillium macrosclerotiorum]
MSNLMHKVKDAMTGHLHSDNKGSHHNSSSMEDRSENTMNGQLLALEPLSCFSYSRAEYIEARDTYNSSDTKAKDYGSSKYNSSMGSDKYGSSDYGGEAHNNSQMGNRMEEGGKAYGTATGNNNSYGLSGYESKMDNSMNTGNNYGATTTGIGAQHTGNNYGSSGYGSSTRQDSRKPPSGYGSSAMGTDTYGSNTRTGNYATDTQAYGTGTGGLSSGNMNTRQYDTTMSNKMGSRMEGDVGDKSKPYIDTTASNMDTTNPSGAYSSNYGAAGSNAMDNDRKAYNTRSSDMANQMENRAESEFDTRTGQQGFGGTAAGGSSYNAPESGKRRSSGPHSSNLLNKLDPRVRSSDYQDNTAGNQRGY